MIVKDFLTLTHFKILITGRVEEAIINNIHDNAED